MIALLGLPIIIILSILIMFQNIVIGFLFFVIGMFFWILYVTCILPNKTIRYKKNEILCIDIETTGIEKSRNEILQLSIINGNFEVLYNSYIKPDKRKRWEEAEKINKISPEMVADAPSIINESDKIINIMNKGKLFVGYNIDNFDLPFLEKKLNRVFRANTCDIMLIFSEICGEWSDYFNDYKYQKLSKACSFYNIENKQEHNSLGDTTATLEIFYKMLGNKQIKKIIVE